METIKQVFTMIMHVLVFLIYRLFAYLLEIKFVFDFE